MANSLIQMLQSAFPNNWSDYEIAQMNEPQDSQMSSPRRVSFARSSLLFGNQPQLTKETAFRSILKSPEGSKQSVSSDDNFPVSPKDSPRNTRNFHDRSQGPLEATAGNGNVAHKKRPGLTS